MCLAERKTDSRGRSGVPAIFFRMLNLRRLRAATFTLLIFFTAGIVLTFLLRGPGLADLAPDDLFHVLHALALVGLGGTERPDLGRRLTDQLLVDPRQGQDVLLDLRAHALGEREHDGV